MNRRNDSKGVSDETDDLLGMLGLTEYEEQSLERLLELGRTTAPDLAEATGVPRPRIYEALDDLADAGYVEVIPGRPKQFQPKPPDEILDTAVETRRQQFTSYRQEVERARERFLSTFQPVYEQADEDTSPTEELFHVVSVGEPSERETRRLYADADDRVHVFTKSFDYFEAVEPAFADALDRGLTVRVLCLDPDQLSPENRRRQRDTVATVRGSYSEVQIRFAATKLPWRGTLADPSLAYDSGEAVLLVEEEEIPLYKRQAAVTDNHSFVAGLDRYFDLTWHHDTVETDPYG